MKPKILFGLLTLSVSLSAQIEGSKKTGGVYSLDQAIKTAIANNLQVKQSELNVVRDQISVDQTKYSFYPTVNGSVGLNSFAGRNINPFTNDVITNLIGSNSFGVQSQINIWDANRTKNDIISKKLMLEATKTDVKTRQNDIALQVAVAYLNILSQKEQLEVTLKQIEVTRLQLDRTRKQVDGGLLSPTQLFDLEAQLANDELSLVNGQNNLSIAKLSLKQLMNLNDASDVDIEGITLPNPAIGLYNHSPAEVYETAVGFLPEIQALEIRKQVDLKQIEIAEATNKPSLVGFGSWGTNYTTAAEKQVLVPGEINKQSFGNVDINGTKVPLVVETPKTVSEKISYPKQFSGNMNGSVGVSLRLPIFNGFSNKFNLQSAKLQQESTNLQLTSVKLGIRQSIDQAFANLSNAAKRYTATQQQVKTLEEALRAATVRLDAGSLNSVDFNIAKSNLDRANASLVQAKFDYIFRTKILDFYMNKSLSF